MSRSFRNFVWCLGLAGTMSLFGCDSDDGGSDLSTDGAVPDSATSPDGGKDSGDPGQRDADKPDVSRPDAESSDAEVADPDSEVVRPDSQVEDPDSEVVIPDSAVIEPDAEVEGPDAEVEGPDAEVEGPDAVVERRDAEVVEPDSEVVEPDSEVEEADAEVEETDAEVDEPDAEIEEPDSALIEPDAEIVEPDMGVVDINCPGNDDLEPNDDAESATALLSGEAIDGVICGEDHDVFTFDTVGRCELMIRLDFAHDAGDLDFVLRNEAGDAVAEADSEDDNEELLAHVLVEGSLYLDVFYFLEDDEDPDTAGNAYSLLMELRCTDVPECPVDDPTEPNDTPEDASPVVGGESIDGFLCGEEQDFYAIELREGCTIDATLSFDPLLGDLDLGLIANEDELVDSSEGVLETEQIVFEVDVQTAGMLYLWVVGYNVAVSDYTLDVAVECEEVLACVNDDPYEENDERDAAAPVPVGEAIDAVVCGREQDWFTFEAGLGCLVTVDTLFSEVDGDIDAVLRDSEYETLDDGTTIHDNEHMAGYVRHAGAHYVMTSLWEGVGNTYEMTVNVECPQTFECPADDGLEDNDQPGQAIELESDEVANGIVCGADIDYYSIEIEEGCTGTALLDFPEAEGNLVLRLVDGEGNVMGESMGGDGSDELELVSRDTATYYLMLALAGGASVAYSANINVSCPEGLACPWDDEWEGDFGNNSRGTATDIEAPFEGEGIVCGADADIFTVWAETDCTLTADLSFVGADGNLDMELLDSDGRPIQISDGIGTDEEHTETVADHDGMYFVRVTLDGADSNIYALAVDVVCGD